MKVAEKAIVLHTLKYSDRRNIVQLFTRKHGKVACMAGRPDGKRGGNSAMVFSPLALVEAEITYSHKRQVQQASNLSLESSFTNIWFEPLRNSIAMFLSEIVSNCLHESNPDEALYDYLFHAIQVLDVLDAKGAALFHLKFLCDFSRFLGFEIENNFKGDTPYFDAVLGRFNHCKTVADEYVSKLISILLQSSLSDLQNITVDAVLRTNTIDVLLDYYKRHHPEFRTPRSLEIFREIMR